jgi:hypothetical protein
MAGIGAKRTLAKTLMSTECQQATCSRFIRSLVEVLIGGTQRKDFLHIRSQGGRYDLPNAFLLKVNERRLITRITCYLVHASAFISSSARHASLSAVFIVDARTREGLFCMCHPDEER